MNSQALLRKVEYKKMMLHSKSHNEQCEAVTQKNSCAPSRGYETIHSGQTFLDFGNK